MPVFPPTPADGQPEVRVPEGSVPVPEPGTAAATAASEQHTHFLVQAPVPVLDVDGFNVTILGLIAFAVGAVVTGVFYSDLQAQGRGWWLGVCLSGFLLGLIGMAYCLYRRGRRRAGRWDRD
jgi:hypothetical protein